LLRKTKRTNATLLSECHAARKGKAITAAGWESTLRAIAPKFFLASLCENGVALLLKKDSNDGQQ